MSISTNGGTSFTNRTTTDGLGSNEVWDVYVVGSTVYLATTGGLSISTDGGATFTNKTTADGLGSNYVIDVYVDGSNVYAATLGGLSISADCPPSNNAGSASSSSASSGLPGIYLYVAGSQGRMVPGTAIHHGAYAVAPNSPYSLTVEPRVSGTGSRQVSAAGVTSEGGNVEEVARMGALPAGSYKIVMVSYNKVGQALVLTNHVDIDSNGRFVSVSPESAQPVLR